MRFSDSELFKLRAEFEQHQILQEARWEKLAVMVEQSNTATRELAESVRSIADSTSGIVRVYEDVQGAARVGRAVQAFLLWLAKWGTIGVALAAGVRWALGSYLSGPPGPGA